MTTETALLTGDVQERAGQVLDFDVDRGTVDVKMVPYEIEALVEESIREVFTAGAFARTDSRRVKVSDQQHHRAVVIGHAIELRDEPDGLYGTLKISDTSAGRDTLTLLRDQVLDEVSIEFVPQRRYMRVERRGSELVVRHDRATLIGVSPVSRGAYGENARVLAVRAAKVLEETEAAALEQAKAARAQLEQIRTREIAHLRALTAGAK